MNVPPRLAPEVAAEIGGEKVWWSGAPTAAGLDRAGSWMAVVSLLVVTGVAAEWTYVHGPAYAWLGVVAAGLLVAGLLIRTSPFYAAQTGRVWYVVTERRAVIFTKIWRLRVEVFAAEAFAGFERVSRGGAAGDIIFQRTLTRGVYGGGVGEAERGFFGLADFRAAEAALRTMLARAPAERARPAAGTRGARGRGEPRHLPPELTRAIAAELAGEPVLWRGAPTRWGYMNRHWHRPLAGVVVFLLPGLGLLATFLRRADDGQLLWFGIVGTLLLGVALPLVLAPAWAAWQAGRICYVVTGRRVILFEQGWRRAIRSFEAAAIAGYHIARDGAARDIVLDLGFEQREPRVPLQAGFLGVADFAAAEEALRELIARDERAVAEV